MVIHLGQNLLKDILKGSAVIFFFKVAGAASLFGVHLFIARHYGASTLGVYSLVLALLTFGAIFSRFGLDMYVVRVLPGIENDQALVAGFIQKTFKLLFLGSIVSMLFLLILSSLIDKNIFKSVDASSYLVVLAMLIVPFTYFNVIPEIFRGFQDVKIYSFYKNLAQNLSVLLVLVLFVNFLNIKFDPVWVLFVVLFAVTVLMVCHLYLFLKEKGISLFDKGDYREKILVYSYPMLFTSSMMFLMGNIDSFMIGYFLDEAHVGIYSACLKLSFAITLILASVNGFIAPKISKAYVNRNYSEIKRIYINSIKIIVVSSIPIFLAIFSFPGFFLGLFGKEFVSEASTLIIINIAFFINALCGSVGYILNMTDNQGIFAKLLFVGLVMNVVLNFILIPSYQLTGAAVAILISMSFWNIGGLIILRVNKII